MMERKLTLKELAPYLPYGLKCLDIYAEPDENVFELNMLGDDSALFNHDELPFSSFRPFLRPLFDLTKEITVTGETFVPIVQLAKIAFPNEDWRLASDRAASQRHNVGFRNLTFWAYNYIADVNVTIYNQIDLFQKLHEWLFDLYGLIEDGLAVDLNTLEQ